MVMGLAYVEIVHVNGVSVCGGCWTKHICCICGLINKRTWAVGITDVQPSFSLIINFTVTSSRVPFILVPIVCCNSKRKQVVTEAGFMRHTTQQHTYPPR